MITLLLAAALGIAGPEARTRTMPADPRIVVAAMFEAFNRHDTAALERLYAVDARLTSPDFCRPRGHTDIARTYAELFAEFPDIRDDIETMVADGDQVAVRFRAVSAKAGMTLPIQAMIRVRDGLIVKDDSLFDTGGRPCR